MKKVEKPPYDHELDSTESRCAKSCPACLWLEQFEATGDTRPSPISERPDLTAHYAL